MNFHGRFVKNMADSPWSYHLGHCCDDQCKDCLRFAMIMASPPWFRLLGQCWTICWPSVWKQSLSKISILTEFKCYRKYGTALVNRCFILKNFFPNKQFVGWYQTIWCHCLDWDISEINEAYRPSAEFPKKNWGWWKMCDSWNNRGFMGRVEWYTNKKFRRPRTSFEVNLTKPWVEFFREAPVFFQDCPYFHRCHLYHSKIHWCALIVKHFWRKYSSAK